MCSVSSDIAIFLVGRMLQALGGCAGLVLGRAMVRDVHGPDRAASVIGYMVMVTTVATGVAPATGGLIDASLGWHAVFIVLAVAGFVVLVCSLFWAPETLRARTDGARREALLTAYPRLLTRRRFLRFSVYSALLFASFHCFVAGAPMVIIDLWSYSAVSFGAWWTIGSLSYLLGNFIAGRHSQQFGIERMLRYGEPLLGSGAILLLLLPTFGPQHPLAIFLPIAIIFIGSGVVQPNAISGAIDVDPAAAGSASALLGCLQIAFGICAITILGMLPSGSTFYFSAICSGLLILAIILNRVLR